ncbi:DUF4131 domain-containing protein [Micrococcales bacterium 31B]|nr:DUF4131 domain-containing protein [Micrococcales bacterium 31B]
MTVASPPQPVTRAEALRAWRERRRRLRRWEAPPFRRSGGPASPRPRIYQVRLLAPLAATWLVMALAVVGRPVPPWLAPAGLAVVCLVGFVVSRRPTAWGSAELRAAQGSVALALTTLVCALVAGLLAGEAMERRDAGIADLAAARAVATLTGTVLTTPRLLASSVPGAPQQAAVTLAASHVTGRGTERDLATRVTLFAPASDAAALLPGSAVTVTGRLAPPSRAGDVAATLRLTRVDAITEPRGVRALPQALRRSLDAATERLPADRTGLVRGMTFGDTRLLPDSDADALKTAGLTHLTAVSGDTADVRVGKCVTIDTVDSCHMSTICDFGTRRRLLRLSVMVHYDGWHE